MHSSSSKHVGTRSIWYVVNGGGFVQEANILINTSKHFCFSIFMFKITLNSEMLNFKLFDLVNLRIQLNT